MLLLHTITPIDEASLRTYSHEDERSANPIVHPETNDSAEQIRGMELWRPHQAVGNQETIDDGKFIGILITFREKLLNRVKVSLFESGLT